MKIYNLFCREYWKEVYEDTHMGCFSTPDKAVDYARMIERSDFPQHEHPFIAYFVYEDEIDPTEADPKLGSILLMMDRKATTIFFRRGDMACSSMFPP